MTPCDDIKKRLTHKDWNVRQTAFESIGTMEDPEQILGLIRCFEHEDWFMKETLATALGQLRSPPGIGAVVRSLKECPWFITEATRALGLMGVAPPSGDLIDARDHEPSSSKPHGRPG